MAWSTIIRIWLFLTLLCTAFPAAAQEARISLGVAGGVGVPIGPSDRFVPRFVDPNYVGDRMPTQLVHFRPKTGMVLQLEALIGRLSIRYAFERFGWRDDRIACAPASNNPNDAILRPNGEYDDRGILYDCGPNTGTVSADSGRRALQIHQLSGAMEFVAIRPRMFIPYATVGGGILLTTFHTSTQNNALRPGLSLLVGGGLRIPFDRNISMFIEARYGLHLMARGGDYSLRAGRAVAADKSVLSATLDPLHNIQAVIGFRLRVR